MTWRGLGGRSVPKCMQGRLDRPPSSQISGQHLLLRHRQTARHATQRPPRGERASSLQQHRRNRIPRPKPSLLSSISHSANVAAAFSGHCHLFVVHARAETRRGGERRAE
eukprot:1468609-Pleurochrysis_carterae.AAC.1